MAAVKENGIAHAWFTKLDVISFQDLTWKWLKNDKIKSLGSDPNKTLMASIQL